MELTPVGALFLGVTLVAWAISPKALLYVLSASAPLAFTAGVLVGDSAVSPFHLVAIVVALRLVATKSAEQGLSPFTWALVLFAVLGLVSIAVAWLFFEGTQVLLPREGIDGQVHRPGILNIGLPNLAQATYLGLGVAIVLLTYRVGPPISASAFWPCVALGTSLCTLGILLGESWPGGLFDNWPTVDYSARNYAVGPRARGVFPESSLLALYSLTALAFCAGVLAQGGRHRIAATIFGGLALLQLILSNSGTAIAGIAAMTLLLLLSLAHRLVARGRVSARAFLGVCIGASMVVATSLWWWQRAYALAADKIGSESASNRFSADLFSLRLMIETYGLGVGLGSSRPSSFASLLASNVGILGLLAFIVVALLAVRALRRRRDAMPALWAFVALLTGKVISEPSLSQPMMWVILAIAAASSRAAPDTNAVPLPPKARSRPFAHSLTSSGRVSRERSLEHEPT